MKKRETDAWLDALTEAMCDFCADLPAYRFMDLWYESVLYGCAPECRGHGGASAF